MSNFWNKSGSIFISFSENLWSIRWITWSKTVFVIYAGYLTRKPYCGNTVHVTLNKENSLFLISGHSSLVILLSSYSCPAWANSIRETSARALMLKYTSLYFPIIHRLPDTELEIQLLFWGAHREMHGHQQTNSQVYALLKQCNSVNTVDKFKNFFSNKKHCNSINVKGLTIG